MRCNASNTLNQSMIPWRHSGDVKGGLKDLSQSPNKSLPVTDVPFPNALFEHGDEGKSPLHGNVWFVVKWNQA